MAISGELIQKGQEFGAMAAGGAIDRDSQIIRIENEQIMALAQAKPVDYKLLKADLEAKVDAFPVLAEEAIYNKPVGRENDKCGDCGVELYRNKGQKANECFKCHSKNVVEGKMKYARNLSVRAAETLADSIGFNKVRAASKILDDNTAQVSATFTNFRNGRIWEYERPVSRLMTRRDKTVVKIDDDRFMNVVLPAEQSKATREAINRSLDAGLKKWFFDLCDKKLSQLLDDNAITAIISAFKAKKIDQEILERLVDKPILAGWTQVERTTLLGIYNALKDGEVTPEQLIKQAMGDDEEPEPTKDKKEPPTGAVSTSDFDPEPKKEPAQKEPEKTEPQTTQEPQTSQQQRQEPAGGAPAAEQQKAAEPQAQSQGGGGESDQKQVASDAGPDPLEGLGLALSNAKKASDVLRVVQEFSKKPLTEPQKEHVLNMAEMRKAELAEAKKQGSLMEGDDGGKAMYGR